MLIFYLRFQLLPIFSPFDGVIALSLVVISYVLFSYTVFYYKILKFKVKKQPDSNEKSLVKESLLGFS
jgi:hypothetical protein